MFRFIFFNIKQKTITNEAPITTTGNSLRFEVSLCICEK